MPPPACLAAAPWTTLQHQLRPRCTETPQASLARPRPRLQALAPSVRPTARPPSWRPTREPQRCCGGCVLAGPTRSWRRLFTTAPSTQRRGFRCQLQLLGRRQCCSRSPGRQLGHCWLPCRASVPRRLHCGSSPTLTQAARPPSPRCLAACRLWAMGASGWLPRRLARGSFPSRPPSSSCPAFVQARRTAACAASSRRPGLLLSGPLPASGQPCQIRRQSPKTWWCCQRRWSCPKQCRRALRVRPSLLPLATRPRRACKRVPVARRGCRCAGTRRQRTAARMS
mmetsp:Transcript_2988/g.12235  ORF Transcript_2988/g.12235 Transcript_2988/m.12235 type:complete len:283 (-) Transcript_2988:7157-8005(-)